MIKYRMCNNKSTDLFTFTSSLFTLTYYLNVRVSLCFAQAKNAGVLWAMRICRRNWQLRERARLNGDKASLRRRKNNEYCERIATQDDYVSNCLAGAAARNNNLIRGYLCASHRQRTQAFFGQRHTTLISFAGMAELADAQDLGSCVNSCRFKSCYPHQTVEIRTQSR